MRRRPTTLNVQARLNAQEQMRFRAWLGNTARGLKATKPYVAVIDLPNGRKKQAYTDVCQIELTWAEKERVLDPSQRDALAEELMAATDRHIEIPELAEDEIPFVVAMQKSTRDKDGLMVPGEYFVVWGDYVDDYPDYDIQMDYLVEILAGRHDQHWLSQHYVPPAQRPGR